MSTLTCEQHRALLEKVVSYLKRVPTLQLNGLGVDMNALSLVAEELRQVLDVDLSEVSESDPDNLESMLVLKSGEESKNLPVLSGEEEWKLDDERFAKYMSTLEERGYFSGVSKGSEDYENLWLKARVKFCERFGKKKESQVVLMNGGSEKLKSEEVLLRAEELKKKGNEQLSLHMYESAVSLYSEAIELNPLNAVYYSNRAAAYSSLGEHMKAIEDSRKSIEIDPNYAKAYSRLGFAYFSLGKYKEAIEEGYERFLSIEPNNEVIQNALQTARNKLSNRSESGAPSDFGGMFSNLMGNLSNQSEGGGIPNLNSLLQSPGFMQMAQQVASNPQMMQMAQQVASNPAILNSLGQMLSSNQNNPPSANPNVDG